MGKLIVSLSPHAHGTDSVERNMYGVVIALLPALLVSFYYFGLGSVVVCLTSVAACMFFEWAICKCLMKREPSLLDGSAIVTGLLLGMNLPSNLPLWIIIIGALVAIGVGKMSFGGLGNNPFNPALVGRCFLLVSFPAQMTSWPVAGQLASYADDDFVGAHASHLLGFIERFLTSFNYAWNIRDSTRKDISGRLMRFTDTNNTNTVLGFFRDERFDKFSAYIKR